MFLIFASFIDIFDVVLNYALFFYVCLYVLNVEANCYIELLFYLILNYDKNICK